MSVDRPQLRPLEIFPFREGGRDLVGLRDPTGIAPEPLFVDTETFFVISLFDGKHTVLDIQEAYVRSIGGLLFSDRVRALIRELDDRHFLQTPEFEIFRDALVEEFNASSVRPIPDNPSYPREPVALAELLARIMAEAPALASAGQARSGTLCALIAPHIDYARGHASYAAAFRQVEPLTTPQLVLLLGTSHAPAKNPFILTRKHFATPFGQAATDVEFVERLAQKLPFDPFIDEFNHRSEHSIELEAVLLKFLLREPNALRIIPVLCGSFEPLMSSGRSPADDPQVQAFLRAVREVSHELRQPTLILAGADLSHVGPQFGDPNPVGIARLAQVEALDMQFLTRVGRADAKGAYAVVAEHSDSTRICGLAPIYTLLELVGSATGRLLKYEQWKEPKGLSTVTFAAVGLFRAD